MFIATVNDQEKDASRSITEIERGKRNKYIAIEAKNSNKIEKIRLVWQMERIDMCKIHC